MSLSFFYRDQATKQATAANDATLLNVRDRCQRAAEAWSTLAVRSERADQARALAASDKLLDTVSENPDRGLTTC